MSTFAFADTQKKEITKAELDSLGAKYGVTFEAIDPNEKRPLIKVKDLAELEKGLKDFKEANKKTK